MDKRVFGLLLVLAIVPAVAAPDTLLVNGLPEQLPPAGTPFEVDSGITKYYLDPGSTKLPGWNVFRGQIIVYFFPPKPGETKPAGAMIDLHGAGGVSQKVPTLPGHDYRLELFAETQAASRFQISVGGSPTVYTLADHSRQTESFTFRATQSQTWLKIEALDTPHYGPYLSAMVLVEGNEPVSHPAEAESPRGTPTPEPTVSATTPPGF